MVENLNIISSLMPLPTKWRGILNLEIPSQDQMVCLNWLEIDLNHHLFFEKSILLLLSERQKQAFQIVHISEKFELLGQWVIEDHSSLLQSDHAGIGHLRLMQADVQLCVWHHTLALNLAVNKFKEQFVHRVDLISSNAEFKTTRNEASCPVCESPIPAGQTECLVCDPEHEIPPSTWTLLKLWRFAKPYQSQLILGFILTYSPLGQH
jgi:ATP-binding cassette subfamily B protein